MPARPWLRALLFAGLAVLPLLALAQDQGSLAPDEEASLREIRDFVQATAERYRMLTPLEVTVASWVGSSKLPQFAASPAVYSGGALHLNRRLLRASNRDLVIATALAYELLRAPSTATTIAERERERAQLTLEAHAKVIDILVRVKGASEEGAVEQMYAWLLGIHRATEASGRPPSPGTVPACDAIGDLVRRFPAVRERFAGRECVPA